MSVDRFTSEYDAQPAYDLESAYFDQEYLDGKAWIARNEVVILVHESVSEIGVVDLEDCETPPEAIETVEVPDDVDTMVDSGETLYELSGGGRTHVIAERYCEIVADLFDYTVTGVADSPTAESATESESADSDEVLDNAYLDTSKANFPVRIDGNGEYDAVISPYLGDTS